MFRRSVAVIALAAVASTAASPARAEVWMVKSSGVLGCRDRATLMALETGALETGALETGALETGTQTGEDAPPDGCVVLFSGERLLDQPEVGVGFTEALRVQRHDGSIVFVRGSAVIPDTGIGSPIDDRAE